MVQVGQVVDGEVVDGAARVGQTPPVPSDSTSSPVTDVLTAGPVTDAPRRVRRRPNPHLITAGVLLTVLAAMSAVPSAFTDADPRDCSLSRSLVEPSWENPFGFDI